MKNIELLSKASCPHCDVLMELVYLDGHLTLTYICSDGCKAEYAVVLMIGSATALPTCGAKRVTTIGCRT